MTNETSHAIENFISRWRDSGAAERANYQMFLSELCDALGVERPQPTGAGDERGGYVFERAVTFQNGDGTTSAGRIDLYKRGCFVLEAKQGSERHGGDAAESAAAADDAAAEALGAGKKARRRKGAGVRGTRGWDDAMLAARGQAEQYARALPAAEGWPPFLVVADIGHSFELYADFTRAGKTYLPFPDAREFRVKLDDLRREDVRERLRQVWTEPLALDPARRTARITREVAGRLASAAKSLEEAGHTPERVASFLMRCIFTMFAEDVQLIPGRGWTELLESLRGGASKFPPMVESLWATMNTGGFSAVLRENIVRFNGGLFESVEALPVTEAQLGLLIEASKADWRDVEPAIFGTLLERALDPRERHKLGAHYTPRAYVERLALPAIIEPLREEWASVQAAAVTLANEGKLAEAAQEVKSFHRRLCRVRVLDPACGTGNFLYVTLEHLKRLEGETLDALHTFGEGQGILEDTGLTIDPQQLLGLEVNPRAAAIADLVLWIGYLQWHFRTRGQVVPPEPVLKRFHNIECRDAVLDYDGVEAARDAEGQPVTRWDGRTFKRHPATGEDVPDETARVPVLRYLNPRKAAWPEADFIIGNPPFIGARRIRSTLNDEYVDALRQTYKEVPETCDYVMYWWHKAASLVGKGKARRFGFITTNSIVQSYSRGLIEEHLTGDDAVAIIFAVPDHPWVESSDGASVRIAMTIAAPRRELTGVATIGKVVAESDETDEVTIDEREVPFVNAALQSGFQTEGIKALKANIDMCFQGVVPAGDGFKLEPDELRELGFDEDALPPVLRKYIIGRDLVQRHQPKFIIDFFGLSESEAQGKWASLYQRLLDRVYPERRQNKRAAYREKWWIFAEPRPAMRKALIGLTRFIVTPNTAKHRPFIFAKCEMLPDTTVYAIASDDAAMLGLLSSRAHLVWALNSGSTLEDRPRYVSKETFLPFPFPDADEQQKARIRELGEQLDAHRKRQQALHPSLTITEMYNVLERLRAGAELTAKERATHEQGLVSILLKLHDDLDAAVADAYGFAPGLADEDILQRLVQLNAERAREEERGLVRWLRPDFQQKTPAPTQAALDIGQPDDAATTRAAAKDARAPWPKTLPEQARAVRQALNARPGVSTAADIARLFTRARAERVAEILDTLASLGQAREVEAGRFVA